ncbi:C40 family peptidase [Streptomyces sp. HD]|uniref:C40 family peptidase n=1 Tax=Streptomyces sp. HD TaxID=3020892 RepID=UPI00232B49F2|nr:C40 family peptidase [Streptomyces sp. HD]MDC0767024.1 NlpC/P60 family protein [Streptomyces sp. HD]
MRNSALASAALTSVALLAQTANAAPSAGDDAPSREEVSRRVSSLYDQAESDTGTFNATRASATGPRKRADRPTGTGRGYGAAGRADDGRRSDPALDNVTRQWFDAARSKLGPTVPATLPGARMPDRSTGTRPARPAERGLESLSDRGPEAPGRAALELPAPPIAELPAAPATTTATTPVAELAAGPVATPEAQQQISWGSRSTQSTQSTQTTLSAPSDPSAQTALALPTLTAEPTAAGSTAGSTGDPQQRSSLRTTKEQNQRKLGRARDLLAAYTGQQSTTLTALDAPMNPPTPTQPSAETRWEALQDMGPADLTPVPAYTAAWAATAGWTGTATGPADTPASAVTSMALDTSRPLDTSHALDTSQPLYTSQAVDVSRPLDTSHALDTSVLDTSRPVAPSTAFTSTAPSTAFTSTTPQDTRAVRALDFARAQLGKPCIWGTAGPGSYDGAGLTQAAWKAAGITLPRTPQEQATAGRGIALTYIEPGDLVLFHVGHVGIYSGNGMMIHAPGPGAVIREESIHYAGESAIHSVIRPA